MATYYATKSYVVSLTRGISEELRKAKSNVVSEYVIEELPSNLNFTYSTTGIICGVFVIALYIFRFTKYRFVSFSLLGISIIMFFTKFPSS